MLRRVPRWSLSLVALLVGAVLATASSIPRKIVEDVTDELTADSFYTVLSPLTPGAPGEVIRTQRLLGAPDGSVAWRVVHHSRDQAGADIAVSAMVIAPDGPAPPGGRPVVAWGHPTTGMAARCAPSRGLDPFLLLEGLEELVGAGFVVAAADYPGMGVAGPSSYLVGLSEAHSVLDAVRAAKTVPAAGANHRVLLWGHSQGGQAVLFAGQEARSYAPDLSVEAIAVAAPATELASLLRDDIGNVSGVTLGSYAFATYAEVYGPDTPGLELTTVLTPAGAAAVPTMASQCLLRDHFTLHGIAQPLVGRFLSHDPATTPPWSSVLAENTPGAKPLGVPVLVAQGETDTLVLPATTDAYVAGLCRNGEHVDYRTLPDTGHGLVAVRSATQVRQWFQDALAGQPLADTCPA